MSCAFCFCVVARTQAQTIYDFVGILTGTLAVFFLFGSLASQYHAAQTKCDYCCRLGHGCGVDAVDVSVVAEETLAEVQGRSVCYRTVFDAVTVCEAQPAKAFRCVGREDGSCIRRSGDGGDQNQRPPRIIIDLLRFSLCSCCSSKTRCGPRLFALRAWCLRSTSR